MCVVDVRRTTASLQRAFTSHIGGYRDTYLGRQVVSRPGGPRAGMGSDGGLRERCELP